MKITVVCIAPWAGDSKIQGDKLIELKKKYPDVHMYQMDINRYPNICNQLNLYRVPTTVGLHKGEIKFYLPGLNSKGRLDQNLDGL